MKNLIFALLIILFSSNIAYCQFPSNSLFLDKTTISKYNIDDIEILEKPNPDLPADSNYTIYGFTKNGLLMSLATIAGEVTTEAYSYQYNKNNQLYKILPQDEVGAHQSSFELYKYLGGKVKLCIIGLDYWSQIISGSNITGFRKYFYYPDQRLKYWIEYYSDDVDQNKVSETRLVRFMNLPESGSHSELVSQLNIAKESKHYFIYYQNNVVGEYEKRYNPSDSEPGDSIAIQRLKKIGFNNFNAKNYSKAIYEQVINDCYLKLSSQELLINNKSVKQFLAGIGKPDVKYIIITLDDKDFLFFKIVN